MSMGYYLTLESEVDSDKIMSIFNAYITNKDDLLGISIETVTDAIEEEGEDPLWADYLFKWHSSTQIILYPDKFSDKSTTLTFGFVSLILSKIDGNIGFYAESGTMYLERVEKDVYIHNYPEYWLPEYLDAIKQPYKILENNKID